MELANVETAIFDVGINSLVARLRELGLRVELERDFAGLVEFLSSQNTFVNPTYHPQYSDLGKEDFWVRILDESGKTVACSAERTVYTNDFRMMVARGTIWYRNGFSDVGEPGVIPITSTPELLRGKIGTSGCAYTLAEWRRHGLAMVTTWLSRLVSFRDFGTGVNTGFVRHSLAQTSVPRASYGYDHIECIINGYFPPQRGTETLYLCWIDRPSMVQRVLELPQHPTNPMPLVASNSVRPLSEAA
jgi:hypothetical protein